MQQRTRGMSTRPAANLATNRAARLPDGLPSTASRIRMVSPGVSRFRIQRDRQSPGGIDRSQRSDFASTQACWLLGYESWVLYPATAFTHFTPVVVAMG